MRHAWYSNIKKMVKFKMVKEVKVDTLCLIWSIEKENIKFVVLFVSFRLFFTEKTRPSPLRDNCKSPSKVGALLHNDITPFAVPIGVPPYVVQSSKRKALFVN